MRYRHTVLFAFVNKDVRENEQSFVVIAASNCHEYDGAIGIVQYKPMNAAYTA
jgi:hypothetical protein